MQMDVEAWLSAKLENPWSSERLASTLSVPTLQQIRSRFALLETPIKLRLLFSFASLRKKLKDELEAEVQDLLRQSSEDDDEWVRVVSKMLEALLKEGAPGHDHHGEGGASGSGGGGARGGEIGGRNGGPSSSLHSHLEALALALNNEHFTDVIEQVRQRLEERTEPLRFYPLEFPYLNKGLVPELLTTTEPHFKLKKPLEEPAPPSILKRSSSKSVPFKASTTPDLGAEKGGLSKSGASLMTRSVSLGGSSPGLRTSTGGDSRGIKRSLNASRGSLSGLSSSQKKLRVLDLDEVLGMEQDQESEKMKKKHAEEEQEKERRRKEKHDIAEAKRQEREEKKKKRNEELEKRKAKKEEEKAEKEAKRKERIAAIAQAKAQRKAAAAAAAASKKPATSPEMSPELSPTLDSPETSPPLTPTPFSPLASPFVASPSPAVQQRTQQSASASPSLGQSGLASLNSSGGIGVTVGGSMGALGSSGISTVPPGAYSTSLSSALHSGASPSSQPQSSMKPYSFSGGLTPLGGPTSSSLGSTPSFLQGTRPSGQASSLLSQALHPSQAPSQSYPGQPSQSSLLSAFSASRQHPSAVLTTQPPSSLLSAYMNQQPQQHTGYGSLGGSSLGLGGPSMSPYGPPPSHLQQHAPPQPVGVPGNLLEQANRLSDRDRQLLVAFLKGESPGHLPTHGIRQILLNEEEKAGEAGARYLEQIIFEINYQSGSWRKLRRKKVLNTAPTEPTKPAA